MTSTQISKNDWLQLKNLLMNHSLTSVVEGNSPRSVNNNVYTYLQNIILDRKSELFKEHLVSMLNDGKQESSSLLSPTTMIDDNSKNQTITGKSDLSKVDLKRKQFDKLYKKLQDLHKESQEDGLDPFEEIARQNAKKVLDFLFKEVSIFDYFIYPDDERAIAIDYSQPPAGSGKGLLILCDSDEKFAYYKTYNHKNESFQSKDFIDFCDKLKKALEPLEHAKKVQPYSSTNTTTLNENFISSTVNFNNDILYAS